MIDWNVTRYRAAGDLVRTGSGHVFVRVFGREKAGVPLLVLHGFPTSSHDFCAVAEGLSGSRPVLLFDFLGYGLSDKPEHYGYSLFEQADTALEVLRAVRPDAKEVDVLAHDMGTSVLCELLARRTRGLLPVTLRSIAFTNGSVFVEMASLTIGQRLLRSKLGPAFSRLNTRATFEAQLARVFAKKPPREVLSAMSELSARENGFARLPQLIRYVEERTRFAERWHGALATWEKPALVAWGERDPVAVMPIGERLARTLPRGELVRWSGIGHYPQVEAPEAFVSVVGSFFER
jgi:pimeloyl-ACP methyl ester carboxylesterase